MGKNRLGSCDTVRIHAHTAETVIDSCAALCGITDSRKVVRIWSADSHTLLAQLRPQV